MDLITILNRCHRFRRFVYQDAQFSADKMSIEVAVRPRKGSTAVCTNSPAWAGTFLDDWRRQTMRSRIEPMKKNAPYAAIANSSLTISVLKIALQRRR
jgi:hypothetical protein